MYGTAEVKQTTWETVDGREARLSSPAFTGEAWSVWVGTKGSAKLYAFPDSVGAVAFLEGNGYRASRLGSSSVRWCGPTMPDSGGVSKVVRLG